MRSRGYAIAVVMLVAALTACNGDATDDVVPPSANPGAEMSPPIGDERVSIDAGTYLVPGASSSTADYALTVPEGWMVQYGTSFRTAVESRDGVELYSTSPDSIFADGCTGTEGGSVEVGASVDDLATALLAQPGPRSSGPTPTTLGGVSATRVDLTIPEDYDLTDCTLPSAMQVWLSDPDDFTVLFEDTDVSVYILDVDGQRQAFVATQGHHATDEDAQELQALIDSIEFQA